ncbi:MAG: methyltransferase domain-containing protein [Chloroflexota bacterium]|nr:MAG: methyltransferase domain-containing protein [Chloroflexota bacterium]
MLTMTNVDPNVNSSDFWDKLYRSDQFHWDLGKATPVFRRLAESGTLKPAAMLVLGAGRGHDARLFARHGFQVTAVDFSAEAVAAMNELADPQFPVEIVQDDFFSLPAAWNNRFDYILDYTSFCAVLPDRRPEYADLVARLLKPGGDYIMLAFPIGQRSGGPPYVVHPEAIIALYAERGFKLQHREAPADSVAGRKGYEELLILRNK